MSENWGILVVARLCTTAPRGIFRTESQAPALEFRGGDRFTFWGSQQGGPLVPWLAHQKLRPALSDSAAAEIRGCFLDSPTVLPSPPHAPVRRPDWCFAIVTATIAASSSVFVHAAPV